MFYYSAMRWTFLADSKSNSTIFWNHSIHNIRHAGFWGGKYHHCGRSLSSCPYAEDRENCRWWWNPNWSASIDTIDSIRVCQVAWRSERSPKDWQTGVIISIHEKGDRGLPEKVYSECLKNWCREILEPTLENTQWGFLPGCSGTNQFFTLRRFLQESWKYDYTKNVYKYLDDHGKA